jgi:diketogulonate reductase-like aldo/keto reductase
VPVVGLGTSTYPAMAEDVIRAAVITVLKLGYRHLDTVALYGSERAVGKAVVETARCGVVASSREEVFMITKVIVRS